MTEQGSPYWSLAGVDGAESPAGEATVVFRRRAKTLEARQRVAYRTSLLVLVLAHFNQRAASVQSLNSIFWATRNSRTRRMFKNWWSGRYSITSNTERSDPGLGVTVRLAVVDGLIVPLRGGERVKLTEKGGQLAEAILAEPNLMRDERLFLSELGPLSDAAVVRRLSGGAR